MRYNETSIVSSTQTSVRIYKDENVRTIKIKINVKATIHEGILKNLFELPDRRMEIKMMR